jgi:glycosyltransferase involved in cell wall biosynthesis
LIGAPTLRVLLSFSTRIGTAGIGMTAWHQATGLAARGAQVHLVTGSIERDMPGVHVERETMRLWGRNVPYRAIGFDRATAFHDRCGEKILLSRRRRFDVVHAWPSGATRTLRAAKALGIPAFLERPNAHTAYAFEVVQRECARLGIELRDSSPHAFNAAKVAREEREFASADALLCPSEFVAATHAARGEPESRLLRHRYGYDPTRFGPAPAPRPPEAPLVVAFVGRLEPRKGVHLALEAWRRADLPKSARLLLCGAMEPGYDRIVGPMIAQPAVEWRGHVTDPAQVMRESDALVLPSLEEGSALVTYEARGCGAILLVSDSSGARVTDGYDALVHRTGDCNELAEHFRSLAYDHALRQRLRANSVAGLEELTWDAASGALLEAYRIGADRLRNAARLPA